MAQRYSPAAQRKVDRVLKEFEAGKRHSGRSGTIVTSRRQAIAIALSQARREGKKVPPLRRRSST